MVENSQEVSLPNVVNRDGRQGHHALALTMPYWQIIANVRFYFFFTFSMDEMCIILKFPALLNQFSHSKVRADYLYHKFNWIANPTALQKIVKHS